MIWKIAKGGNDPVVDFAGEELCRCLHKMDKQAQTVILAYPQPDEAMEDVLWLGVSKKLAASVADARLDDGYAICVQKACGSILGTNGRSVLMGVYRFLKELGCRWIRPGADGEVIPERCLGDVCVCLEEMASHRHRGVCIEGAVSYEIVRDMIDWMPKLGMNAYFNQFQNPVTFYNRWYSHRDNPLLEGEALTSREIEGLRDQTVRDMKQRGLLYHYAGHGWTCDPLGVPGEDWLPKEYNLKRSVSKYLAKVNGRRDIWKGVALNTNLCYSQAAARRKMVDAVVDRCAECPDIDYVHVWLSDGVNNFCECDGCRRMRPADWYVMLLNEIDAKLTKRGLATKVVFLMYHDLLWEPEQQKLRNPDRFVLMFAPITRSYSQSYGDAEWFDEEGLSNFKLNQLEFPKSVGENLARMRRWQRVAPCEGFVYDYHYMWDHFFDPGYYQMAKILFADMRSLHGIGLNGMVSCQNQRVFFPNGLGMTAMAAALWNEKADFDAVAADYFRAAYGEQGDSVRAYMAALSEAFDPAYIRANRNIVSPENARKLAGVERIVQEFAQIAEWNARDASLDEAVRTSWEHLQEHGMYCTMLSKALAKRAAGDFAEGKKLLQELVSFVRSNELRLQKVLDVFEFQQAVVYRLKWDEQTELPVL